MALEAVGDTMARQSRFSERNGTLYTQAANVMRQRIRSGRWPPGRQIPTLCELEREFALARVTLRQALSLLEAEGLIWRQRGRGTFVTDRAACGWFKLETSRDRLVHSLEGNWSRLIVVEQDGPGPSLELGEGMPAPAYTHMRRVHGSGEEPYALVDMHLDRRLYDLAPERFDSEMIIPVLDSLPQVEVADIAQIFTLGTADGEVADHLSVPIGSPIGVMRRVVRDAAGTAIYVGTVNYRGDVVRIEISLTNGASQGKCP
jgi:GntR family transcriptional regulator